MNRKPDEYAFIIKSDFGFQGHVCKTLKYYDGEWDVELSDSDMKRFINIYSSKSIPSCKDKTFAQSAQTKHRSNQSKQ